MMPNIFLISDTHFAHANILTFKSQCGASLRPYSSVEEMDEALIENWNKVVKKDDKVYHLGDVAIAKKGLECLARCNGNKVLLRGNHDIFKLKDYAKYFKDIRGSHYLEGFHLSHIPIHPESLGRYKGNIHGHLHSSCVMKHYYPEEYDINQETISIPDKRYFCASVERINFTPIAWEEVKKVYE